MKHVILFLALIALTLGCVQTQNQQETIKIGAVLPLTGAAAYYGGYANEAAQMAEEDINAAGGIKGAPVRIIVEDSESSPSKGVTAFQKLSTEDIDGAISMLSSVSTVVAEQADDMRIPLITTVTSAKNVTGGSPWVFRYYLTALKESPAMARYFIETGKKRAAILSVNDEYGTSSTDEFTKEFTKKGGLIVATERFSLSDADFRSQLVKIKDAVPEVIYIVGFDHHIIIAIKQAKELGIATEFSTTSALANPTTQQDISQYVDGVYGTSVGFSLKENSRAQNFIERYERKFGKKPAAYSAFTYDAFIIMAQSVGSNKDETRANLEKITHEGVIGDISFDQNHDATMEVFVFQLVNGTLGLVR